MTSRRLERLRRVYVTSHVIPNITRYCRMYVQIASFLVKGAKAWINWPRPSIVSQSGKDHRVAHRERRQRHENQLIKRANENSNSTTATLTTSLLPLFPQSERPVRGRALSRGRRRFVSLDIELQREQGRTAGDNDNTDRGITNRTRLSR